MFGIILWLVVIVIICFIIDPDFIYMVLTVFGIVGALWLIIFAGGWKLILKAIGKILLFIIAIIAFPFHLLFGKKENPQAPATPSSSCGSKAASDADSTDAITREKAIDEWERQTGRTHPSRRQQSESPSSTR